MKKLICLLLIFINCISLCACVSKDDSYVEIWSCIDEFDDVDFDFEKYILDLQNNPDITVEERKILDFEEDIIEYSYVVGFGEKKGIFIDVCYDVDSAKEYYSTKKAEISRIYSPYFSLVRIDNVVLNTMPNSESGSILPDIMNAAGIEEQYLLKIHTKRRIYLKPTDKSLEEIIGEIENRDYYLLHHTEDSDVQVNTYSFVSDDGTNTYEIIACHHENSINYVIAYLSYLKKYGDPYSTVQVFYSINSDYSMMFFGHSIETGDFWNEIR